MNLDHPTTANGHAETSAAAPQRLRLHRPEPARTAPHRNAATLLRQGASADALHEAAGAADGAAPSESPVALGVRLGYQVIEEQILLGQKLAQRLGRAAGKAAASVVGGDKSADAGNPAQADDRGAGAPNEVSELLDRVVHLYKDIGSLCLDAVETLARNPVLRAGMARLTPGASQGGAEATGSAHGPGAGFVVDISCSRRTQVTLDLQPASGPCTPRVHALHAAEPAVAPLTGVCFIPGAPRSRSVLQLSIPDTQPTATYTGVVVDAGTNEPLGTLCVRLMP